MKPTYGLSEEEIERMLVESIEHAEEDVSQRFILEWRVEGDRILGSLESAFTLDGELLTPGGARQDRGADARPAARRWTGPTTSP